MEPGVGVGGVVGQELPQGLLGFGVFFRLHQLADVGDLWRDRRRGRWLGKLDESLGALAGLEVAGSFSACERVVNLSLLDSVFGAGPEH